MSLYDHKLSGLGLPWLRASGQDESMKTYIVDDPDLGRIEYVDRKRYLWLLSVLFPLIPLL